MNYPCSFIDEVDLRLEIANAVRNLGYKSFNEWLDDDADPHRFGARIDPSWPIPNSAEPFILDAAIILDESGSDVDIPNFLDMCADLRAKQAVSDNSLYYLRDAVRHIIFDSVEECLEVSSFESYRPMRDVARDVISLLIEGLEEDLDRLAE